MVNFVLPDNYYGLTDLTSEVLYIPNQWGRLNQMGLFENEGVTNTSVTFDRVDETLTLLEASNRGSRKGTVGSNESVQTLAFPISFFEHSDRVTAADVQGRRRPGSTGEMDQVAIAVGRKLEAARRKHAITHEFMKFSALKGTVVSPDGRTYADLFTSYGFTQEVIDFTLGTTTTDVDGKIRQLIRFVEDNSFSGMVAGNVHVFVSQEFFDKLIAHPKIREAYLNYAQTNQINNAQVNRDDMINGAANNSTIRQFTHMGVTFEEYRASYKKVDGTTVRLIAAGEGHAFPLTGAGSEMYKNYLAPADKMSLVGTLGEEMYAWSYADDRDDYLDIESQSAILPIVRRPQVLVKVITSN